MFCAVRKRICQAPTEGPDERHIWELFSVTPQAKNRFWGNGYDFWTMAGISSAMAVMDRFYSNEETENGECVVGRAPCRGGREQFVFEWMKSLYG